MVGLFPLLIADPNGTYTVCPEGQIPSYNPMRYDPNEIIFTEDIPRSTPATPTQTQQKTVKPKEEKKIEYEPCPPEKALRIGSFVNDKRLERIKDYVRNENNECITLYENVPFINQYVPTPSMAVSTFFVASIAATTPLLLNAIKPLTKQLIKRLTKPKKDKST